LASKWGTVYDGVQRANDVLRVMAKAKDIFPEDQKRIAAEARFLRAHYHFEAKKIWNKIPFIDETVTYENGNYRVSNEKDVWPEIENDLEYSVANLAATPYQGAVGRATKYTAMALLAKAYIFQQKFAQAKLLLDAIINSGIYELVDYHVNFNPETKNSRESVFSVQMSVNDGAIGLNGNYGDLLNFPFGFLFGAQPGACCGFFPPTQYLVNHFKTDAITGLPDLDNFNSGDVKDDEGIESSDPFTPHAGTLDPRLDWTVGRRGIPYLDWGLHPGKNWIRNQDLNGPYSPKKNSYYKSQEGRLTDASFWSNGTTANNVNLIRYADVLLWAAEVEVEIGSLDKAEEYVNRIRSRAANPEGWVHTYRDPNDPSIGSTSDPAANYFIKAYPAGYFTAHGPDFARKAVRYERMLELAMEGHRFFDLIRWNIGETEINTYLQKEKIERTYLNNAVFTKNKNEYFPIPQIQIDLSAGADGIRKMIQNPGY
ncbi:MAG TPA: RagB/SusD family nutrient uptake outer membrane protein, partial [Chitinophagaceae bacterium]|nr:RagB/SusD family nutrient uptake outer membrane protein [Chitinophagaceae bacterium]